MVSKAIVDEASKLKNDSAVWYQKIQELEVAFHKSQEDDEATVKNVNEKSDSPANGGQPTRTRCRSQGRIA